LRIDQVAKQRAGGGYRGGVIAQVKAFKRADAEVFL
jgi:hypothetical protein